MELTTKRTVRRLIRRTWKRPLQIRFCLGALTLRAPNAELCTVCSSKVPKISQPKARHAIVETDEKHRDKRNKTKQDKTGNARPRYSQYTATLTAIVPGQRPCNDQQYRYQRPELQEAGMIRETPRTTNRTQHRHQWPESQEIFRPPHAPKCPLDASSYPAPWQLPVSLPPALLSE